MSASFKRIGITGRILKAGVKETLAGLCAYLKSKKQPFFIEQEAGLSIQENPDCFRDQETLLQEIDLLIVIGGDGSLLEAARPAASSRIPVIGINRGSLGFLTDIHPAEWHKIDAILNGQYTIEERFLLHTELHQNQHNAFSEEALNEIAIVPDGFTHINDFEIYIDERFVCSLRADGLIIATPTGSTAYSLSGGGPILHPDLSAIVIVPMFAHTLTMRPIVISAEASIHIRVPHTSPSEPLLLKLACDGHHAFPIRNETQIYVKKSKNALRLVHSLDYDYYETLRNKLHWGHKLPTSS